MISDIYVGDDGKLHKTKGGADTVLNFSGKGSIVIGTGDADVDYYDQSNYRSEYIKFNSVPDKTRWDQSLRSLIVTEDNVHIIVALETKSSSATYGTMGTLYVNNVSISSSSYMGCHYVCNKGDQLKGVIQRDTNYGYKATGTMYLAVL